MHRFLWSAISMMSVLGGCAAATTTTTTPAVTAPAASVSSGIPVRKKVTPNLITAEEIAESGRSFTSVLDIVESLRPAMLRARGSDRNGNSTPMVAFLDDFRVGDVSALREVPADEVKEIRYFNASDAATRWGILGAGGAIQVIRKK